MINDLNAKNYLRCDLKVTDISFGVYATKALLFTTATSSDKVFNLVPDKLCLDILRMDLSSGGIVEFGRDP